VLFRFKIQGPAFGFQGSGFGFQVSGFRFQVSGFRFLISAFRFRWRRTLRHPLSAPAERTPGVFTIHGLG